MAIRKVVSRSITDGTIVGADIANNTVTTTQIQDASQGGGFFTGDNGNSGNTTSGKADIFRVNESSNLSCLGNSNHDLFKQNSIYFALKLSCMI